MQAERPYKLHPLHTERPYLYCSHAGRAAVYILLPTQEERPYILRPVHTARPYIWRPIQPERPYIWPPVQAERPYVWYPKEQNGLVHGIPCGQNGRMYCTQTDRTAVYMVPHADKQIERPYIWFPMQTERLLFGFFDCNFFPVAPGFLNPFISSVFIVFFFFLVSLCFSPVARTLDQCSAT